MKRSESKSSRLLKVLAVLVLLAGIAWLAGCQSGPAPQATTVATGDTDAVIQARGLTPDDVYAAVKTYVPTGQKDEYVMPVSTRGTGAPRGSTPGTAREPAGRR